MRRVGLAAFEDQSARRAQFRTIAGELQTTEAQNLKAQVEQLREFLRSYGRDHKKELKQSGAVREQFAKLCARLGIDALSIEGDGQIKTKEQYYALGSRVIAICRRTREANGGIIPMKQLVDYLATGPYPLKIKVEDIRQSVQAMAVLGPGLIVDKLPNGHEIIRSLPKELNNDQMVVLMACDALGYVTASMLRANLNWTPERTEHVLDEMLANNMLWIDLQSQETQYWSPSATSFLLES